MQQLFRLLIFLIQPYMFRATNSPIPRSTFWLYIQPLVQCTDSAADWCMSRFFHKRSPIVPVPSHINLVHALSFYFWTSILILSSHLQTDVLIGLFSSEYLPKSCVYPFSCRTCHMSCLHYFSKNLPVV